MEFLRSFLRRHLAGKPVVASLNVGCFLGLLYIRLGSKIIFSVAENMLFCFSLKPQKGCIAEKPFTHIRKL